MTGAQILEVLTGVEKALNHAADAEKWANHGLHDDKSGVVVHARSSAHSAKRELEAVRKILKDHLRNA